MHVQRGRNVHQLFPFALRHLGEVGQPMPSRVGNVIVAPGPVTSIYDRPTERVMFWPERDANPYLHFFEALWMLAGRDDVAFLTQFTKRMLDYSDNGETLHGAYGHRLRRYFGGDQLNTAIKELQRDPLSRRVVLQIWDPEEDLRRNGKDLPCNQQIFLRVGYGRRDRPNMLHMMTTSRSHDLIWGAMGANIVHFSLIHEYLASRLGLDVGVFTQVSWNYHAYEDIYNKTRQGALRLWQPSWNDCPYSRGEIASYPLMTHPDTWDRDLALFFEDPSSNGFDNPFFSQVTKPLWFSHKAYKKKDYAGALEILEQCKATDWRRAATEWIQRRMK